MAANIDTMIYVGETPWHRMGIDMTDDPPTTSEEIIKCASLDWTVGAEPMITKLHDRVPSYHAIYRQDTNEVIGVVNRARPILIQNTSTFEAMNNLINKSVDVETAASLGRGETVFGCFKIREEYKLLDDDMAQYFVVVNDHLKVDGKVTVLNTPIRVVCQNTLEAALNKNFYQFRIPISPEASVNSSLSINLMYAVRDSIDQIKKRAEEMVGKKIDKTYVEKMLDMLFPYQKLSDELTNSRANERTSLLREQFLTDCMDADNLQNYKGTQWQCFNAITDWTQHYHKNADKAYDLKHRMSALTGVVATAEPSKVVQFMKVADKLAA